MLLHNLCREGGTVPPILRFDCYIGSKDHDFEVVGIFAQGLTRPEENKKVDFALLSNRLKFVPTFKTLSRKEINLVGGIFPRAEHVVIGPSWGPNSVILTLKIEYFDENSPQQVFMH